MTIHQITINLLDNSPRDVIAYSRSRESRPGCWGEQKKGRREEERGHAGASGYVYEKGKAGSICQAQVPCVGCSGLCLWQRGMRSAGQKMLKMKVGPGKLMKIKEVDKRKTIGPAKLLKNKEVSCF
jgi:hypothetical protein